MLWDLHQTAEAGRMADEHLGFWHSFKECFHMPEVTLLHVFDVGNALIPVLDKVFQFLLKVRYVVYNQTRPFLAKGAR
jgi:hypothetical protein